MLKSSDPQASQLAESYEFSGRLDRATGKDFTKHLIQHIERFLQRTRKFHLLRIANFTTETRLLAYGIAIAIFVIATILRIVLDPFILPPAPFFTYYTAVLLTAFFCGLWPAVFAVAISGITAWYLFLPPRGSFEVSPHAAIALLAFFTIAVLIVAVVASLHAAIRKILAQEQQSKLLAKELQHRTSNLLTVIQSIAQRSLAGDSPSLARGREILEARLQALARTHQQLTSSKTDAVTLEEIVRSELEAFSSRTKIEGDEIFLDYQQAQKFSLVVHELATNALKYGSLSAPKGAVRIAWSVSNGGNGHELRFRWEEHGGPPVAVPTREGFGSTLLKAAFAKSRMDYAPDGFSCEIEANVSNGS